MIAPFVETEVDVVTELNYKDHISNLRIKAPLLVSMILVCTCSPSEEETKAFVGRCKSAPANT